MKSRGFSLLEFIIIIGILLVLVVLLSLVVDPSKFLAEWRDSRRISDLNNFRADLVLYISSGLVGDICDDSTDPNFPKIPTDPVNNEEYFYIYACNNTSKTFKITANMESSRYANGGKDDVESTDAGNNLELYEVGTDLGL